MNKKSIFYTLLLLIALFSCEIGSTLMEDEGAFQLTITDMVRVKTLVPDISMEITSYDIIGYGPGEDDEISALGMTASNKLFTGIPFGNWNITVYGKNTDGTIIGSGEASVMVHTGETSQVGVTVVPLTGEGSFDISVLWNSGDTEMPAIEARLKSAAGDELNMTIPAYGEDIGTGSLENITNGYYTLIVKLFDNDKLAMGAVEVVRIVHNENTRGTFDFTEINKHGGDIQVNITSEMADPLRVELNGTEPVISVTSVLELGASVADYNESLTYVWYVNGQVEDIDTQSFTISDYQPGIYRLDVTAFSTDGTQAGSATHTVRVVENITSQTISGEGGTISINDGVFAGFELTFPVGAVSESITINIYEGRPFEVNDTDSLSPTIVLEPHDVVFAQPVKITMPIDQALLESKPAEYQLISLGLIKRTLKGTIEVIPKSGDFYDAESGTVSGNVMSFSAFQAIFSNAIVPMITEIQEAASNGLSWAENKVQEFIELDEIYRSYYFQGANIELTGGFVTTVGGIETVWDLWNMQRSDFYYYGSGFATDLAGAAVGLYFGFGRGPFEEGADKNILDAWAGWCISASAGISIPNPFVNITASINPFRTATDPVTPIPLDDPSHTLGFSISASFGLPSPDDIVPFSAGASAGYWFPFDTKVQAAQSFYDNRFVPVATSFVSVPEVGAYLQFQGDSWARKGVELAKSIVISNLGLNPSANLCAIFAIANGIVRDNQPDELLYHVDSFNYVQVPAGDDYNTHISWEMVNPNLEYAHVLRITGTNVPGGSENMYIEGANFCDRPYDLLGDWFEMTHEVYLDGALVESSDYYSIEH